MKFTYKIAENGFRRRYYVRVLRAAGLHVATAADLAQVNRTDFYHVLKKLKISPGRILSREVYRVRPYQIELAEFSKRFLLRALFRSDFSPVKCSRLMGVHRTHVYRMAERLGVALPGRACRPEGNAAWLRLAAPHRPD